MGHGKTTLTILSRLLCLVVLAGTPCSGVLGAQTIRNTRVPVVMKANLVITRAENMEGLVIPGVPGVWKAAHAMYGFPGDGDCMEVWSVLSSTLPLPDNSWSWKLSIPDPRYRNGGGAPVRMALRDEGGYTLVCLPLLFGPDSRTSSPWWYVFRFTVFDQAALGLLQVFVREHYGLLSRDTRRTDADLLPVTKDRIWPGIQGFFPPGLGVWVPD